MYAQRPIVEKQARYAFYHPFSEAIASILCDVPYKVINSVTFNIPLYFISHLRRDTAGHYFFYWLFSIVITFTMSNLFRTIASCSRTLSQALVPAAVLMLAMVIFTGFALPINTMLGWSRWINYLDPVAYAFESMMVNEFNGRPFDCSTFIPSGPGYENVPPESRVCSSVGSKAGELVVWGGTYLSQNYEYYDSHKWRNLGILFAFMAFFFFTHILSTELISESKSKGEVLLFQRGHIPPAMAGGSDDSEAGSEKTPNGTAPKAEDSEDKENFDIKKQTAIFHWENVSFDIKVKGNTRRLLDSVDGWVKPGTCTALMGASGAGKTTLLDVLATRVTIGTITGEMLVDGRPRDQSFQRKTGYVQQQDLHLHTTTVREALRFSAVLRQPAHVSRKEKYEYVEEVVRLLGMEQYAGAVVGVPGEGTVFCSMLFFSFFLLTLPQVLTSSSASVSRLELSSQRSRISFCFWTSLLLAWTVKLLGLFLT